MSRLFYSFIYQQKGSYIVYDTCSRGIAISAEASLKMFIGAEVLTRGGDEIFPECIPIAINQLKITIRGAGHFLQEQTGEGITNHLLEIMARTPQKIHRGAASCRSMK